MNDCTKPTPILTNQQSLSDPLPLPHCHAPQFSTPSPPAASLASPVCHLLHPSLQPSPVPPFTNLTTLLSYLHAWSFRGRGHP